MTYGELLIATTKILSSTSLSPRLDSEILISHTFRLNKAQVLASLSSPINQDLYEELQNNVQRRLSGEPIAYITGIREFYGREFLVTPDVLIPRPETEELITESLNYLRKIETPKVLDLGTGSGCLAITIASEIPDAEVVATDISENALKIAKQNSERLCPNNKINFFMGSWFSALHKELNNFDLVISNPPYILKGEEVSFETKFEPDTALYSPGDGLDDVREILREIPAYIKTDGLILIECGGGKHELLESLVRDDLNNLKIKGNLESLVGWRYLSSN